ncbi:MAG: hypothetical protein IPJ28_13655 [Betaproteobacteria bacterium]|nr:hypothetical protein [Betaproteobacteria bacterium]
MIRFTRTCIASLVTLLAFLFLFPAHAALPESGWYWTANESGRGFNLEIQDNTLFMAAFAYRADGSPVWYVTGGSMSSDRSYSGDLYETAGGQCIGCNYRPANLLPVGRASVTFTSERSASVTLLGNTISVVRQDWSNSGAASRDALFGEWSTVDGDPSFPVYYAERISLHTPGNSSSGPYAGGNRTGSPSSLAVGGYEASERVFTMLMDSSTSFYQFFIFTMNGLNRIEGLHWTYRKTEQLTGSGTYFLGHRTKSYARVRGLNAPGVSKADEMTSGWDAIDAARAARSLAKAAEVIPMEGLAIETVRAMARELEAKLHAVRP